VSSFDHFWACWDIVGTKRGRGTAERAYERIIKSKRFTHADIVAGVKRYMKHCRYESTELRFIKHPATWLNAYGWMDEYPEDVPSIQAPLPLEPNPITSAKVSEADVFRSPIGLVALREGWGSSLWDAIRYGDIESLQQVDVAKFRREHAETIRANAEINDLLPFSQTLKSMYSSMLEREAVLRARYLNAIDPLGGYSERVKSEAVRMESHPAP